MVFASSIARAQTLTVDVSPGSISLGRVYAGSSATTFRINPSSGAVTVEAGNGSVGTVSSVSPPVVTVRCTDGTGSTHHCSSKVVYVKIGQGSATAPVSLLKTFTQSGASLSGSVTTGTTSTSFKINAVPTGSTGRSFTVGMDVPVAAYTTTGNGSGSFYVWVDFSTPTGSISDSGTVAVQSFRPIALAKNADLAFGRVVKPASGSGVLTISSAGARSVTGDVVPLNSTFNAASYTVTGEGGQMLNITVPSSFTMTTPNSGTPITVTTNKSAVGLTGLTGSLNSTGSYTFNVGGSFNISNTTPTGAYSGSFNVTVDYY